MYEFHGWISIEYHTHDTDLDLQEKCVNECFDFIKNESGLEETNYKLVVHNGIESLLVSGQHNHTQDYVLDTFKWIAEHAEGSFGILTVFDDEEEIGNQNFKHYVVRRGKISEVKDTFFSPRQPTIEDYLDMDRD